MRGDLAPTAMILYHRVVHLLPICTRVILGVVVCNLVKKLILNMNLPLNVNTHFLVCETLY